MPSFANSLLESLECNILRLKLLQTLKAGTKEEAVELIYRNASLLKLNPNYGSIEENDLHVLHIAVQVGTVDTVRYLYQKFRGAPAFDINSQEPTRGDTPLHVAARCGNSEAVMYLMSLDELNDTIVNADGLTAIEVARTPELAEAMQVIRDQHVQKVVEQMKEYCATSNTAALEELLAMPRASAVLDINGQDPETGSTVLHDFVKARNATMVEFVLQHGGDPFRRNSKGVLPIDMTKDENIRRIIKQHTRTQRMELRRDAGESSSMLSDDETPHLIGPPPSMKGFLKKWTNFTTGYKLRWFVLENGVLSYYKRQGDTENACRGSINMKHARLHVGSTEKLQFEIHSKGSPKFNLKANHPVETSRWVYALTNAIQYAKDQERLKSLQGHQRYPSATSAAAARLSAPASTYDTSSSHLATPLPKRGVSSNSSEHVDSQSINSSSVARLVSMNNSEQFRGDSNSDLDDDEEEDLNTGVRSDEISSCEDSIQIGLSSVESTIKSLRTAKTTGRLTDATFENGLSALEEAMGLVNTLMKQYSLQIHTREEQYRRKIEKNDELQAMWTATIREMEAEKEKMEESLYKVTLQRRRTSKVLREVTGGHLRSPRQSIGGAGTFLNPALTTTGSKAQSPPPQFVDVNELTEKLQENGYESVEDSEDEFFDALVEEGDKPDLKKFQFQGEQSSSSIAPVMTRETEATTIVEPSADNVLLHEDARKLTPAQHQVLNKMLNEQSFAGYEDPPRTRLAISDDERPKISLWGVLKSLIGKDMTKMTLPVSFNECTNLLMRSAEDMEYTDLLDTAASLVDDPSKRMVYIAAYAASSYSSTIDRVAKPFNPLLGETFEYSRPDKGYRMFSEQVSHHPPIGALIAESPRWDFYGASNVKSKFNGRSFDINPLGLWYIRLRPNSGAGVEEELYSFRKVTSSVVGIITGSPVVDQYGDMEITNHTLGHKCVLKFKARGWRGANAYEVKGTVVDKQGIPKWFVGGRWNSKIYAKKLEHVSPVAISNGVPESGDGSSGVIMEDGKDVSASRILVWQVHERPKAPFNLTQFAITLNALPERLRGWLAPTDTRLRPDQRAMEEARYDEAADEKVRVEEKQRAARRKREHSGQVYKPQWFETRIHPVSKQEYWAYKGEYWQMRAAHELGDKGDIF